MEQQDHQKIEDINDINLSPARQLAQKIDEYDSGVIYDVWLEHCFWPPDSWRMAEELADLATSSDDAKREIFQQLEEAKNREE